MKISGAKPGNKLLLTKIIFTFKRETKNETDREKVSNIYHFPFQKYSPGIQEL